MFFIDVADFSEFCQQLSLFDFIHRNNGIYKLVVLIIGDQYIDF
jgi:hypothetical protein